MKKPIGGAAWAASQRRPGRVPDVVRWFRASASGREAQEFVDGALEALHAGDGDFTIDQLLAAVKERWPKFPFASSGTLSNYDRDYRRRPTSHA